MIGTRGSDLPRISLLLQLPQLAGGPTDYGEPSGQLCMLSALCGLAFRLAASQLLHFALLRSTGVIAGLLRLFRFALLAG